MRGISVSGWRTLPALAVPVLETGMEEAVVLAESMDARGHGRGTRTRYRPVPWRVRAVMTAVAGATGGTAFAVAAVAGDTSLTTSTFPLGWPVPSNLLLGACVLFAAPAFLGQER